MEIVVVVDVEPVVVQLAVILPALVTLAEQAVS
jgi:hypothetical protein